MFIPVKSSNHDQAKLIKFHAHCWKDVQYFLPFKLRKNNKTAPNLQKLQFQLITEFIVHFHPDLSEIRRLFSELQFLVHKMTD
jgi:hypothetical protein